MGAAAHVGRAGFHGAMRFLGTILFVSVIATLVVQTLDLIEFQLAAKHLLTFISAKTLAPPSDTEPQVKGTPLRGQAAVSFREHVACFSQGKWVYDPTPRYFPENLGDQNMGTCDLRWLNSSSDAVTGSKANAIAASGNRSLWKVREDLKWRWQPNDKCPYKPFEREAFCRQVGVNRNIMIVGDSLNQEVFYIFMSYLLPNISATGHRWPLHNDKDRQLRFKVCEDVLGGDGFYVGYVRNDRVSLIVQYEGYLHDSKLVEWPWVSFVDKWNTSILILNRGAHYEDDNRYREAVLNAYAVIQSRFPYLTVFYRNTMSGHPNCSEYRAPIPEPQDLSSFRFHWKDFGRQNLIAQELTHKFHHIYLDVATPLNLRPDAHHTADDCLHYCLPGPLDMWMEYFYNVLLLLNSEELLAFNREAQAYRQ